MGRDNLRHWGGWLLTISFEIAATLMALQQAWYVVAALALAGIGTLAIAYAPDLSGKSKMISLAGMIFFGLGFVGCAAWYFWPSSSSPIVWTFGDGPHPVLGMRGGGDARPLISRLQITGTNSSDSPLMGIDGYVRSNVTNREYPLYFQSNGRFIRTIDTNGVPPHTDFMIIAPFADDPEKFEALQIPATKFMAEFGDLTLSIHWDGGQYTHHFPRAELEGAIDNFERSLRVPIASEITPNTSSFPPKPRP